MPYEEYWVGKGIDLGTLWGDFERGNNLYVGKYFSTRVYLLQLSFEKYEPNFPLFNLEAILKTSKGLFHNLKKSYFSLDEYNLAGPLHVYDICRGSEKWRFLAELKPLLLFAIAIWNQIRKGTARHKAEQLALVEGLRQRFPNSNIEDIMNFVNSLTMHEEEAALQKLYDQNLKSIAISTQPFVGDIRNTEKQLLSLDDISSENKQS